MAILFDSISDFFCVFDNTHQLSSEPSNGRGFGNSLVETELRAEEEGGKEIRPPTLAGPKPMLCYVCGLSKAVLTAFLKFTG